MTQTDNFLDFAVERDRRRSNNIIVFSCVRVTLSWQTRADSRDDRPRIDRGEGSLRVRMREKFFPRRRRLRRKVVVRRLRRGRLPYLLLLRFSSDTNISVGRIGRIIIIYYYYYTVVVVIWNELPENFVTVRGRSCSRRPTTT